MHWTIGYFPSGKEFKMRARFGFPSVRSSAVAAPTRAHHGHAEEASGRASLAAHGDAAKRTLLPASVRFEVPYFAASGMQVRYLKIVEKSGYSALPWVRYVTQNGDYLARISAAASDSGPATPLDAAPAHWRR